MNIRPATEQDIPAITEIYNQAIRAGGMTADLEEVTQGERRQWLAAHNPATRPVFVAEEKGTVCGYLSLSDYRSGRSALHHTAEISYYLHHDFLRLGIGSALMRHALAACPACGIDTLIAIVLEGNAASIKLLEGFDFARWGHLPEVAHFGDRRIDHLYFGKQLKEN
ncbi:MAG: N-acetyltransferase [Desulfuromonas sp.]|nr:MAG: N-acetyltransferase [Desulfuromonas sp.]